MAGRNDRQPILQSESVVITTGGYPGTQPPSRTHSQAGWTLWIVGAFAIALLAAFLTMGLVIKRGGHPLPPGITVYKDILYVTGGTEKQTLDLYLPHNSRNFSLPLIINIHGGGFKMGDKNWDLPVDYLSLGYAVASINYRLSQDAKFPAQIHDCKAAVRWLKAHASDYSLDKERFASWGQSAGGHLSAMLGTTTEYKGFDVGENLDQSSNVRAVVGWFGPTDFLQMDAHRLPDGMLHDPADSPESQLIGVPIQEAPEAVERANPITYITKNDPPFLVCHGDADRMVPYHQSVILVQALQKNGVPVTFYTVKGEGHGGWKDPTPAKMTRDFLAAQLKPIDPNLLMIKKEQ